MPAGPATAARARHRADSRAGAARAGLALFLAGVATFASLYSTQALLPVVGRDLGVTPGRAPLSVSLATAGLAVGLVVAGPLSDVVGRTRVMRVSLVASVVLGVACALAPGWTALLVLRTGQGVALAGLPAVAASYLREEVPAREYPRIMGRYVAGTALGGMSGRLVTSGLAGVAGWRGALVGLALVAGACAFATHRLLPASRHFTPSTPGLRRIAGTWRLLAADRVVLALCGVGGTLMGAFVSVYNVMEYRLEAAPYRLPVALAGLVFCVYAVGSAGSALGGRWAAAFGPVRVVPVGAALMAAGLALTAATRMALVVAGLAVATFGFFAAHGVASGWVAARAQRHAAQATAMYLLVYYAGSSVAGAVAGSVWTAHGWPGVLVLTLGLVLAGAALAVVAARAVSPRRVPPAEPGHRSPRRTRRPGSPARRSTARGARPGR